MRYWLLLFSVVPLFAFAHAAMAATQTDFLDCQQIENPDRGIAGCTKIVEDPSNSAHDRAVAHFDRGVDYYAKDDFDHAIVDWSEAITLDPNYTHAYNNRAKAYRAKGDYEHAIADYSEAIRLDPQHALAFKGRGIAYLLSGQAAKAEPDLRQAATLEPWDLYAALWLDIATRRNNQPSYITQSIDKLGTTSAWPAPIVFWYAGRITPRDVIIATQDQSLVVHSARLCDADFYGGELVLSTGDKDQAAKLFQNAVKSCAKAADEYPAAVTELKTLGKPIEEQGASAEAPPAGKPIQ